MNSSDSLYQLYLQHPGISTDTRNISPGTLFFALKGANFDANHFAAQALSNGAAYAIIDNAACKTSDRCILVPDVLTALQDLARLHRSKLSIPVIGLTGTNGKTTTKELINAVLAEKYKTFATKGNLNNHIGVPLSILSITRETAIAIIEMGANHQKEIEFLCSIAQPTHGLITNVGMAHLEGFGGFEGVKKGKAELYTYLKQHNGTIFINHDNPHLLEMSAGIPQKTILYYGTAETDTICGRLISADPLMELAWNATGTGNAAETQQAPAHQVSISLTGAYNFENVLAAISAGHYFGLSPEQINRGLSGYQPRNNRSQLTKTANNTVICDFYNANPSSMSAALRNIAGLNAPHKAVIIGDMFELGDESLVQHDLIAGEAAAIKPGTLMLIGKSFFAMKDKYPGLYFSTPEEASAYLEAHPLKNNLVLLKGSRGMALEKLLPLL